RGLPASTRPVPPRPSHVPDPTGDVAGYRLAGPRSLGVAEAATLPLPPAPGRVVATLDTRSEVAHAPEGAPFTLQITVPAAEAETLSDRLAATGALVADAAALEFMRILAGWPQLGDRKSVV